MAVKTEFGFAPGFAEQAITAAQTAIGAEERGQTRTAMDQLSRFGSSVGGAQEAVLGGIRTKFADVSGNIGRQVGVQAAGEELQGRRISEQRSFQSEQSALDRAENRYLTNLSVGMRERELKKAEELAAKKRQMNLLSSIITGGLGLAGGLIGGGGLGQPGDIDSQDIPLPQF